MTEKQFWMKLDQMAGNSDKITEFIQILRQGYDEDLTMLIACHHIRPGEVGQMYVNLDERNPERENNRYLLCYTSRELADRDPSRREPWEKVPLRAIVDNALNKPVIGGFIFNKYRDDKFMAVPKQMLGDFKTVFSAMKTLAESMEDGRNPFLFSEG